jgi:hypothetical protein
MDQPATMGARGSGLPNRDKIADFVQSPFGAHFFPPFSGISSKWIAGYPFMKALHDL